MVSAKGKEKVIDAGRKGKRKLNGHGGGDDDKTGRKRRNPGVLQFIDHEAGQSDDEELSSGYSSDGSGYDTEMFEDGQGSQFKVNNNSGKAPVLHNVKEEENEEEWERIMEERYKPGSGYVTYAEDENNTIDSVYVPSAKDPTIWKVKCMVDVVMFGVA